MNALTKKIERSSNVQYKWKKIFREFINFIRSQALKTLKNSRHHIGSRACCFMLIP